MPRTDRKQALGFEFTLDTPPLVRRLA